MKKSNKMITHKYKLGDIVGVVGDCMADCKIVRRPRKKKGQALTYVATAIDIHHPNPKESFFGKNKYFIIPEKRIVVKLGEKGKKWKPVYEEV